MFDLENIGKDIKENDFKKKNRFGGRGGLYSKNIDIDDMDGDLHPKNGEGEDGEEVPKEGFHLNNQQIQIAFACLFQCCGVGLIFYLRSQDVQPHELIAGMIAASGLIIIGFFSSLWYSQCHMDIEQFQSHVKYEGQELKTKALEKKIAGKDRLPAKGKADDADDGEIIVGDEEDTSDIETSEDTIEDDLEADDPANRGAISFPSEKDLNDEKDLMSHRDFVGGTELEMTNMSDQNNYDRVNIKRGPSGQNNT